MSSEERLPFSHIYMSLALMMAKRSTCARLHVGCVITSTDNRYVYGVGYNGNAAGLANGCDSEEPGKCGCLHAEDNAVINCTAPRDAAKVVYTTNLPCIMCAKRIINLGGVELVNYAKDYRDISGLKALASAGIRFSHMKEFDT